MACSRSSHWQQPSNSLPFVKTVTSLADLAQQEMNYQDYLQSLSSAEINFTNFLYLLKRERGLKTFWDELINFYQAVARQPELAYAASFSAFFNDSNLSNCFLHPQEYDHGQRLFALQVLSYRLPPTDFFQLCLDRLKNKALLPAAEIQYYLRLIETATEPTQLLQLIAEKILNDLPVRESQQAEVSRAWLQLFYEKGWSIPFDLLKKQLMFQDSHYQISDLLFQSKELPLEDETSLKKMTMLGKEDDWHFFMLLNRPELLKQNPIAILTRFLNRASINDSRLQQLRTSLQTRPLVEQEEIITKITEVAILNISSSDVTEVEHYFAMLYTLLDQSELTAPVLAVFKKRWNSQDLTVEQKGFLAGLLLQNLAVLPQSQETIDSLAYDFGVAWADSELPWPTFLQNDALKKKFLRGCQKKFEKVTPYGGLGELYYSNLVGQPGSAVLTSARRSAEHELKIDLLFKNLFVADPRQWQQRFAYLIKMSGDDALLLARRAITNQNYSADYKKIFFDCITNLNQNLIPAYLTAGEHAGAAVSVFSSLPNCDWEDYSIRHALTSIQTDYLKQKKITLKPADQKVILAQFEHEWSFDNPFRKKEALTHLASLVNGGVQPEIIKPLLKRVAAELPVLDFSDEEKKKIMVTLNLISFLNNHKSKDEAVANYKINLSS